MLCDEKEEEIKMSVSRTRVISPLGLNSDFFHFLLEKRNGLYIKRFVLLYNSFSYVGEVAKWGYKLTPFFFQIPEGDMFR